MVEITSNSVPTVLAGLELTDLCGIAERSAVHLHAKGIHTPLQFYNHTPKNLLKLCGIWGRYLWRRLHGYEVNYSQNPVHISVSH